jgi:hypothetical protein
VLPAICHDGPGDGDRGVPVARWQATRQIGRRRRFWFWAVMGALVMIVVMVSWAFSKYHNAGGWPTRGFSPSSWPPIPNVWNDWIIWPAIVWVLATSGYAWLVFGREPASAREIKREMGRQAGRRR